MRRSFLWLIPLLTFPGSLRAAEQKYKLSDVPSEEEKAQRAKKKAPAETAPVASKAQIANEVAEDFFNLGTKAMEVGNLDLAEGYFDRALILKPNHKGAKEGIETILRSYDQPVEPEEKTITKEPVNVMADKKIPEPVAEDSSEKEDPLNIEKSDQLYIEALSANQTGNTEDARNFCNRALVLNPDNLQAKRMLDRLGTKSGQ